MAEDFLSDRSDSSIPSSANSSNPNREAVRIVVVGSRQGVMTVIHTLHNKNFAQADEWSDLQIESMTGKLLSVLTKYVWVD